MEQYVEKVCKEALSRKEDIKKTLSVNTLYIGGGTPSVLPPYMFWKMLDVLGDYEPFDEFTIEVNPEDIIEKGILYAKELKSVGADRISMGVQSFDDGVLKWMNRRHDSYSAKEAFSILRDAGFKNISIDLIFGIGQLSDDMWMDTVNQTLQLSPEHVSAYQLSIEEDSALALKIAEGQYSEASEDQCRRQYDILCTLLRQSGYCHYEVSNFARSGYEARHNSAYWHRVPYVGLGASAHSFLDNKRSWNSSSVSDYKPDYEILDLEDERVETIMLSLRTSEGIDKALLMEISMPELVNNLLEAKALVEEKGCIRIPEDHFFVSDEIIKELI